MVVLIVWAVRSMTARPWFGGTPPPAGPTAPTPRQVLDERLVKGEISPTEPTLVRMQGYKVAEMPVNHRARQFGVSKYGAMNRAFRGLADCLAVRWMSKRVLDYRAHEDA